MLGVGDFIVTLIISLFISKLYNFDPYNNKCKSLSLDKIIISESRLKIVLRSSNLIA